MSPGDSPTRPWRAQPPTGGRSHREWRISSQRPAAGLSRRTKLSGLACGLAAFGGLILVLLVLLSFPSEVLPTRLVTFGVEVYREGTPPSLVLPVNTYARTSAGAFQELTEKFPEQFPEHNPGDAALTSGSFRQFLEKQTKESAGRNLIVYCSMHALVGSDREAPDVLLYPLDARADSPETGERVEMIRLQEIVAVLEQSRAAHVVLALDCANLESAGRLGLLVNDVAAAVRQARGASESPSKVAVLLAAGPGERSRGAEGLSQFARFLIEGLSGQADGVDTDHKDRLLTLRELHVYTQKRVAEWSLKHTGQLQTVELLQRGDDWILARVTPERPRAEPPVETPPPTVGSPDAAGAPPPPLEATGAPAASPESPVETLTARFERLWKRRQELAGDDSARAAARRRAPYAWRRSDAFLTLAAALPEDAPMRALALDEVEREYKSLEVQVAPFAREQADLERLGLFLGPAPTDEVVANAGQFAEALLAPAEEPAAPAGVPAPPQAAPAPPSAAALQAWFLGELCHPTRGVDPAHLKRLARMQSRLQTLRAPGADSLWPSTAACALAREVLARSDDGIPRGGAPLQRLLTLQQKFHQLAVSSPESLRWIKPQVLTGCRALDAAERWLLEAGTSQPDVRRWLDKADDAFEECARGDERIRTAAADFADVLAELPGLADWIGDRAGDSPSGDLDWESLPAAVERANFVELATLWQDSLKGGRAWDPAEFLSRVPSDFELQKAWLAAAIRLHACRAVLGQPEVATANLNALGPERSQLWRQIRSTVERIAPPLTPRDWRDAERLRFQPWVTWEQRQELEDLLRQPFKDSQKVSREQPAARQAYRAVWRGFFMISALTLFAPDQTDPLWDQWRNLVVKTQATSPDEAQLLMLRCELGRDVRRAWQQLQHAAVDASLIGPYLAAGAQDLDPAQSSSAADARLQAQHREALGAWLNVLAEDWSFRTVAADGVLQADYNRLAGAAGSLARQLHAGTSDAAPTPPRLGAPQTLVFDSRRQATLELKALGDQGRPLSFLLGKGPAGAHYLDGGRKFPLDGSRKLTVPPSGVSEIEVMLGDQQTEAVGWLVALLDADDGFPHAFRRIPLKPPADPTRWQIRFVNDKGVVLHSESGPAGCVLYLPPSGDLAFRAELVRPEKDATPSAKVALQARLRNDEPGRLVAGDTIAEIQVELTPGQAQTPLEFDLPVPPPAPGAPAPAGTAELARLDDGWIFQITPEGQDALHIPVRLAYWTHAEFLNDVEPQADSQANRLRFLLARADRGSAARTRLPAEIDVQLRLAPVFEAAKGDSVLRGKLGYDQPLELGFSLPPGWFDPLRPRQAEVALDVAGQPHALRWRIDSSGRVTPVSGARLALRLHSSDPRAPLPFLRQNKDDLILQFEVDSANLDQRDSQADWRLVYRLVNRADSKLTTPWGAVPIRSSLDHQLRLKGLQKGLWKVTKAARDYEVAVDLAERLGRFRVEAELREAGAPVEATAALDFVIDDDAAPTVAIARLPDPHPLGKPLALEITAADEQSGISELAAGFDENGNSTLEPDERLVEQKFDALQTPRLVWKRQIPAKSLPSLQKDLETRRLLVEAKNGLGTPRVEKRPVALLREKENDTGLLIVTFKTYTGEKTTTVRVKGPVDRVKTTKSESVDFNLPAGEYTIQVDTTYPGFAERGEDTATVAVGEKSTVAVETVKVKAK